MVRCDSAGHQRLAALVGHVLPGRGPRARTLAAPLAPVGIAADPAGDLDIDVDRVAYGFMASQALFAALELGLFDHVAAAPLGFASIDALKERCGVDAPRLQTLVTALTAIRALRRGPAGYSLSPNAAKFLVRSSKFFYGDYLRMQIGQQFYRHMAKLPEVMRTGEAPDYATIFTDSAEADLYTRAQHNGSLATAAQLCKRVDFGAMRSMLDIGGGSGAFSIVVCRRWPQMSATVLELPEVCKTGRAFVAGEPAAVASRIAYVAGSCLDPWPPELGHGHCAVLISYVSESVPAAAVPEMYARAFERLKPGGLLVVHSFMVDDTMDGPDLAALWSLQHVAVNAQGLGLTPSLVAGLMKDVGFQDVSHAEMIGGMTKLVIGKKPM